MIGPDDAVPEDHIRVNCKLYKKVLKEPIGKGGMGKVRLLLLLLRHGRVTLVVQVFKCSALEDGHICAIKKIKLDRKDTAAGALPLCCFNDMTVSHRGSGCGLQRDRPSSSLQGQPLHVSIWRLPAAR
jgi:hypothetical protein